jgi:hypothetical protein
MSMERKKLVDELTSTIAWHFGADDGPDKIALAILARLDALGLVVVPKPPPGYELVIDKVTSAPQSLTIPHPS